MKSDTSFIPVTGTIINTGTLNTCIHTVDQYIHYTIDGTNYVLVPQFNDSVFAAKFLTPGVALTHLVRQCFGMNCSYPFQLGLPGNSVGTFIFDPNCGLQVRQYYSFNMPSTANATFTSYGNVGENVEGSFYVPFIDNTDSLNHLLTGTFKLIRKQ